MGERAIALFDAPVDRSFEPQIHADGRGWGKGRSLFLTKNFLMVQAPGFIRGINPKSQI